MTTRVGKKRGSFFWIKCFSPTGFLIRAALIGLFFLIVQLAGFREHTTFLTGTPADAHTTLNQTILFGVVYLVAYFGFVVAAPVLILAAGLFSLLDWLLSKEAAPTTGQPD